MNATEIEDRLHDLISEAKISGRPIEQIYVDSSTLPGIPYSTITLFGRRVIVLHPTDWAQLLNRYDWGLTSLTSGKYFFRGIPVYLTDQPEAASLPTMLENDPRYEKIYNILKKTFGSLYGSARSATVDIIEALDAPPEPVDWVGVTFKDFDSPAQASAWAKNKAAKIFTYYASQRMKLTIGDVVEVEDGSRPATVVELNAPHNANLVYKKVLRRNEQ